MVKLRLEKIKETWEMSMQDQLNSDLKTAMKARDKTSLDVIRGLKSQLTNKKIELGHDLSDQEASEVVLRELKQQKESLVEFEKGGREDLAEDQKAKIAITEKYAPKQMSAEEVKKVVEQTAKDLNASAPSDFGKVMGAVMPKLKGQADGNVVKQTVKELLG